MMISFIFRRLRAPVNREEIKEMTSFYKLENVNLKGRTRIFGMVRGEKGVKMYPQKW